jgi:hypothetical protein
VYIAGRSGRRDRQDSKFRSRTSQSMGEVMMVEIQLDDSMGGDDDDDTR